jgi:hypothetical protein
MKVSDLEGAQLDYWAAKALADRMARIVGAEEHERCETRFGGQWPWNRFMPSGAWMDGGPIIERERGAINPEWQGQGEPVVYWARMGDGVHRYQASGPTHLVSAMRAYVASKFGEEVPDEMAGAR